MPPSVAFASTAHGKFCTKVGATHLPFYADPTGAVLKQAKEDGPMMGLPTTFLVGRDGCVVGTMPGPTDWASEEAKQVVEALWGE